MASAFRAVLLFTLVSLGAGLNGAVVGNDQRTIDASGQVTDVMAPNGALGMNATVMSNEALPEGSRNTNNTVVADWQREYRPLPETAVMETPPIADHGMPPQVAIGTAIIGFCAGGIAWSCCVSSKTV